MKTDYRKQSTE